MLTLQTFATLIANMAAAAQSTMSGSVINFATGSMFEALNQASASVMLWLQWQLTILWLQIRAATSSGASLDSWMADFGVTREMATYATGAVTFTRFTSTASATIPVGATVLTGDLTESFAVVADPTNAYYVPASSSYLVPAGVSSATIAVQSVTAGPGGNVAAGAISLLGTALAGVDTVTNAASLTNGTAAETDAALRARFIVFVNTRSLATPGAVVAVIIGVQSNLIYSLFENYASNGAFQPGFFTAVVDDGSGSPSSALLSNISAAINAVRPVGSTYAVVGPVVTEAAVVMVVTPPATSTIAAITPAIQAAVTAYIDALPIYNSITGNATSATLFPTQLSVVAGASAPAGTTVTSVSVNGSSSNILPANMGAVRCSGVTVT